LDLLADVLDILANALEGVTAHECRNRTEEEDEQDSPFQNPHDMVHIVHGYSEF
jgi:hypothetical protein